MTNLKLCQSNVKRVLNSPNIKQTKKKKNRFEPPKIDRENECRTIQEPPRIHTRNVPFGRRDFGRPHPSSHVGDRNGKSSFVRAPAAAEATSPRVGPCRGYSHETTTRRRARWLAAYGAGSGRHGGQSGGSAYAPRKLAVGQVERLPCTSRKHEARGGGGGPSCDRTRRG